MGRPEVIVPNAPKTGNGNVERALGQIDILAGHFELRPDGRQNQVAQLLVIQTIIGAGRMLRESGVDPEELRLAINNLEQSAYRIADAMYNDATNGEEEEVIED